MLLTNLATGTDLIVKVDMLCITDLITLDKIKTTCLIINIITQHESTPEEVLSYSLLSYLL